MDDEKATPRRKYLGDTNRFGYMRRGKKSSCIGCGLPISVEDLRFWDNEKNEGPICLISARKALGASENDQKPSVDAKAIESIATGQLAVAKILDMVLDKLEKLEGNYAAIEKKVTSIGHMVVSVETGFKKLTSGRQGGSIPEIDMRPPAPAYPRSLADCPLPGDNGRD